MYRTIQDFLNEWPYESGATVKVFKAISEDKKAERANQNIRSLERLAWHLTQTLPEMMHKAGALDKDELERQPIPGTMDEIIKEYEKQSQLIQKAVADKWKDNNLTEEVNMYGMNWKKGQVLSTIIKHQTHHRGQMIALMRVYGMKVPGIYGPAKEEWTAMGMEAME
jgi:uncharacterized damage-inducible protein DinB